MLRPRTAEADSGGRAMIAPRQNLSRHLRAESPRGGATPPGIATLIEAIAGGAIRLARELRRAALEGETGLSGVVNPTGDSPKRLDVVADPLMTEGPESTRPWPGRVLA